VARRVTTAADAASGYSADDSTVLRRAEGIRVLAVPLSATAVGSLSLPYIYGLTRALIAVWCASRRPGSSIRVRKDDITWTSVRAQKWR